MIQTQYTTVDSAVGKLWLAARDKKLVGLWMDGQKYFPSIDKSWSRQPDVPVLALASEQIGEYFAGNRQRFTVPLEPAGTDFQREVWQALTSIEFGRTTAYGKLAHQMGKPRAVRAVAAAVGRNPVSIIIPCHRVVGADGSLTGYAGGIDRKKGLLGLEADANS